MDREDVRNLLGLFNPWWARKGRSATGAPAAQADSHTRALLERVHAITRDADTLITGPRLSGKSFLLGRVAARLLREGHPAANLCRCDLTLAALRGVTLDAIVDTWLGSVPVAGGVATRLLLDGVDHLRDWPGQLRGLAGHGHRITATALAAPEETGADGTAKPFPWGALPLGPLSFLEFLEVTGGIAGPRTPPVPLARLPEMGDRELRWFSGHLTRELRRDFTDYLARGIFPGPALAARRPEGQWMIARRLIGRTLREDLPARHQARDAAAVEPLLSHLAGCGDTVLDLAGTARAMGVTARQTIDNWATHLIDAGLFHRVPPLGYGETVKRGRDKLLAAHPALLLSHLMDARPSRTPPRRMGPALESAALLHLRRHLGPDLLSVAYHRGPGGTGPGADLVAGTPDGPLGIAVLAGRRDLWRPRLDRLARFLESGGGPPAVALCQGLDRCRIIYPEDPQMRPLPGPGRGTVTLVPPALFCLALSMPAPEARGGGPPDPPEGRAR